MIPSVRKPTKAEAEEAASWPIWEKEPSTFPYSYSSEERFLVLEGSATVTSDGKTVSFGAGDYVVMPKGMKCTWKISKAIKKRYSFG